MQELCRLAVSELCDVSLLAMTAAADDAHRPAQLAVADGGKVATQTVAESIPGLLAIAIERVAATGTPERLSSTHADDAEIVFPGPRIAHSVVVLPLSVRGRPLAVLALGMTGPRAFDPDATSVASDLAGRGAAALENALLYHRIQESDQRKNDFLAMLAHELRNPLAPIGNAVHVLRASAHDFTKIAWASDVIGRQVKQLTRLVDDLLDLSRVTRDKIDLKLEPLDASDIVAAAVETHRPVIDSQKHALVITLPPEPVAVHGDFARLAQVLGNLVNNAAKYTDPGGKIHIELSREGYDAVFRVRDTGMGIPAYALSSVFEPFTQLERTLDRSQGGLGIGLTLVRRLVEMQGGSVTARSAGAGQGSEFVVRLPATTLSRNDTPPVRAVEPEESIPEVPLTVLVVDDNVDVAESTAILLRVAGCEVHVAPDGRSALAAMDRLQPDAVLLDIGLPGMDGYQVAERMRERPEFKRTLIVAVSGYGQDEYQARSRNAGVDHHLVKPIDPAAVIALLAKRTKESGTDPKFRTQLRDLS